MKPRTPLFLPFILLLVALGGILFFHSLPNEVPAQVFPATVDRDCAPWDCAAFTVSVQYDQATTIIISIWRSPDIKFPATFPMPDDAEAEQDGYAYILPELGPYVQLNGEVSFESVEEGTPVAGRFSFTSERGERFEGQFIAEWGEQVVMCG